MPKLLVEYLILMTAVIASLAQSDISGFGEYDYIYYFRETDSNDQNGRNQMIVLLELNHRIKNRFQLFSAAELRNDQANPSRNRIYMDEAYIDMFFNDFDIRLGKQIYAWGRADGINPTDNLSAWDFSDVLDTEDEKIGQISLKLDYYLANWTIESVLAPTFTPSKLPQTDSRWFKGFPEFILNPYYPAQVDAYIPVKYEYGKSSLPDNGIESWQYAFRVNSTWLGWDFSLSWFDGYDDLPGFVESIRIDSAAGFARVELEPVYNKKRAVGIDFSTIIGSFGLRGEAAYYLTEDWDGEVSHIDDPYLHYVVGLDRTFTNLIPDKNLFILIQWSREIRIPDRSMNYRLTDLNHLFRNSISMTSDLDIGQYSKFKLQMLYNIYSKGWYIRPAIDWSLTGGVHLIIQTDLLDGPEESFFGPYSGNSRLQLKLKYSF